MSAVFDLQMWAMSSIDRHMRGRRKRERLQPPTTEMRQMET
jgi:hypothetical protein